jgi:hypothetical protein
VLLGIGLPPAPHRATDPAETTGREQIPN